MEKLYLSPYSTINKKHWQIQNFKWKVIGLSCCLLTHLFASSEIHATPSVRSAPIDSPWLPSNGFQDLYNLKLEKVSAGLIIAKETNAKAGDIQAITSENRPRLISSQQQVSTTNGKDNNEIRGIVKDAIGAPIVGVTIRLKGKNTATVTDKDGNFSIGATKADTLVISRVGYLSQEIVLISQTAPLIIMMVHQTYTLDAVVVTAMGIKRSTRSLTYNVQEIGGEELTKAKDPSFINALAGKTAGVTINKTSGLGGSTRVVMRGVKSITRNNNALYVIDGIPLQPINSGGMPGDDFGGSSGDLGDGISNLNPEDIESISVLTGAAAAALYGGNAANGVIVINTKKGAEGKLKINFSSTYTIDKPFISPSIQNTYGSSKSASGDYAFDNWGEKLNAPSKYNPRDFFKTGMQVSNSLSISTGTEKSRNYASFSTLNGNGIINNNSLDRYNFYVKNNSTLIPNKLTMEVGVNYIYQQMDNPLHSGQYINPLIPIYLFPLSLDINDIKNYERYNPTRNFNTQYWPYGALGMQAQNPYWTINRMLYTTNRSRIMGNALINYTIGPWLNLSGRLSLDEAKDDFEQKNYASTITQFTGGPNGSYHTGNIANRRLYSDLLLTINKKWNDFDLNVVLGTSITDNQSINTNLGGPISETGVPNLFALNNIQETKLLPGGHPKYRDQQQSVFGTFQVGYKKMAHLDFTMRRDWISQLSFTDKQYTTYPSVGLNIILSEMVQMPAFISSAKIRSAFTKVGNPPASFLTQPLYNVSSGGVTAITSKPFDKLKPEETASLDAGINIGFINNTLNLSATYYNTNTINQIFAATPPPGTGFSTYYVNAGKINNKGMEVSLDYKGQISELTWSPSIMFAFNRNKIVESMEYIDPFTGKFQSQDSLSVNDVFIVKGGSISDIYGNPLLRDQHGNAVLTSEGSLQRTRNSLKLGNWNPDFNLSMNNVIKYKNAYLSFLIDARIGGQVVSATNKIMDQFGSSILSAQIRNNGGVTVGDSLYTARDAIGFISDHIYDATNVRLRELTAGYTFSSKYFKNKVESISIGITARNVWMIYNKAPFDPDLTMNTINNRQGYDYFMPPSLRNIGVNLKVSF